MQKLIIEIEDDLKRKLRLHTASEGITIKEYVVKLLEKDLKHERTNK